MFNRLPPELVRQIIESAIPFNFDIYTYDDRQATLRAICLVSRRFAQIAQPILFEVVWIKSSNKLEVLFGLVEAKRWASTLREVFLEGVNPTIRTSNSLNGLARHGQGLRALVLHQPHDRALDLLPLQVLPSKHPPFL